MQQLLVQTWENYKSYIIGFKNYKTATSYIHDWSEVMVEEFMDKLKDRFITKHKM